MVVKLTVVPLLLLLVFLRASLIYLIPYEFHQLVFPRSIVSHTHCIVVRRFPVILESWPSSSLLFPTNVIICLCLSNYYVKNLSRRLFIFPFFFFFVLLLLDSEKIFWIQFETSFSQSLLSPFISSGRSFLDLQRKDSFST